MKTEINVPPLQIKSEIGKPTLDPKPSQAFGIWARDTFDCFCAHRDNLKEKGKDPSKSPVLFMLCCRTIELSLKSRYPENTPSKFFKKEIRHNLEKAYNKLDDESVRPHLSHAEKDLLKKANDIYSSHGKDFDYPNLYDTKNHCDILTTYTRFPDLDALADLAKKVLHYNDASSSIP